MSYIKNNFFFGYVCFFCIRFVSLFFFLLSVVDLTILAYVLSGLNCCHNYGLDLFILSVDEGIIGYRDDSLETVKRNEIQVVKLSLCLLIWIGMWISWEWFAFMLKVLVNLKMFNTRKLSLVYMVAQDIYIFRSHQLTLGCEKLHNNWFVKTLVPCTVIGGEVD